MASAFDGGREFTLVLCAGSRLASRPDFTVFGNETAQEIRRFIIDYDVFIGTELANLRPGYIPPE